MLFKSRSLFFLQISLSYKCWTTPAVKQHMYNKANVCSYLSFFMDLVTNWANFVFYIYMYFMSFMEKTINISLYKQK